MTYLKGNGPRFRARIRNFGKKNPPLHAICMLNKGELAYKNKEKPAQHVQAFIPFLTMHLFRAFLL
jgi:hypothetical protein